jgi:probable addiction module antidote protein
MIKTKRFDIINYLKTEADVARYLEEAFAENDPDFIPIALGDAARALGKMSEVAKSAGIKRPNAYRALSSKGNPAFKTVAKAVNSLGYRLSIVSVPN